jgi:hypothetical protein
MFHGARLPSGNFYHCWFPSPKPNGKVDKIPCDIFGNTWAPGDQPRIWWPEAAVAASAHRKALRIEAGYFFVDLDNVIDPVTGGWLPVVAEVCALFPGAFMERSQSGTGLHIIGRGTPPAGHGCKWEYGEFYSQGRFCALTGAGAMGDADTDCSAGLALFIERYGLTPGEAVPEELPEGREAAWQGPEDDDALIALIRADRPHTPAQQFSGTATAAHIWDMDAEVLARTYPPHGGARADGLGFDHSTVDAALMSHLSYFTGRDMPRMKRLFERWRGYRAWKYTRRGGYHMDRIIARGVRNPRVLGGHRQAVAESVGAAPPTVSAPLPDLRIVWGDEILATEPAPRKWVMERWLPDNQVTLFGGDGAAGKSLLAIQLGAAVASGTPFFGIPVTQGRVIYVSAEDEFDEVRRRVHDLRKSNPFLNLSGFGVVNVDDVADPAIWAYGEDGRTPAPTAWMAKLEQFISEAKPKLVILDPLADLYGGDEIKRKEVRGFISALRQLAKRCDCAIVLLAHPSAEGMKTNRGYSGSTAWNNSVRSRWYLSIGENGERKLSLDKTNRSQAGEELRLKWSNGVYAQVNSAVEAEHAHAVHETFIELLKWHEKADQRVSPSCQAQNYFGKLFVGHELSRGFSAKQFSKAYVELKQKGIVDSDHIGRKKDGRQFIQFTIQYLQNETGSQAGSRAGVGGS